jgi:CheY-like chemotaxis protein
MYVIDDDKIYHFLLKNLFKQNNIDVNPMFFSNGQDAIESIKQNKDTGNLPDLILLDVNMPIMDGWQFLEEYSKLSGSLTKMSTIYMISSSNDEQDINKAKNFSTIVKEYFLKPICKRLRKNIYTRFCMIF